MPIEWYKPQSDEINLDDLVKVLDSHGPNVLNSSYLDETAIHMSKLYNNKTFFYDILSDHIAKRSRSHNGYTAQVIILHITPHYAIRATIWEPSNGYPWEDIFYYTRPHDHNFNLMTLGYIGAGYKTIFHRYDYYKVTGYLGEEVELEYLTDNMLSPGKVMFIAKNEDIHAQYPPLETSVAINIIALDNVRPFQFEFDTDKSIISSVVSSPPIEILALISSIHEKDKTLLNLSDKLTNTNESKMKNIITDSILSIRDLHR